MRKIKLTKLEQTFEDAIERGDFVYGSKEETERIAKMLEARKKDAVLNIRINSFDLKVLKQKAAKLGVKYQTFIAEILHKVAQA